MVLVQLDLNDQQNDIVRVYMVKNRLTDKRTAVARIIEDYDYLVNQDRSGRRKK